MSRDLRRSTVACFALLLACLLGGDAQAQIRRDDISTFPSDAWFDTGGGSGDGVDGDILGIDVEYKTIGGEEWGIFRFQTNLTDPTSIVAT